MCRAGSSGTRKSAADRVRACALEELGSDVSFGEAPILVMETILDQRDRGHAISLLYRCRLLDAPDPSREARSETASAGQWRWHESPPPDLLDVQRQYARFF